MHLWVLEDPQGVETIDSVSDPARQADFISLRGRGFSGGFSRSIYWFRLELAELEPGHDGDRQWLIEMMPPYLDDLRVYVPDADRPGGFERFHHGDHLPFADRQLRHRAFLQLVQFKQEGPKTLFIRLETTSSALLTVKAWAPGDFLYSATVEYALLGVLFGIMLASLLANLVRFVKDRDPLTRDFAIYLLSIIFLLLAINGLLAEFVLSRHSYWVDRLTSVSALLVAIAAARFYRVALALERLFPRIAIVYRGVIWLFVLLLPAPFLGVYVEVAPIFFLTVLVMLSLGLIISLRLMSRDVEGGKVLLAAHVFSLMGSVSTSLTLMGWLPGDFWLIYAHQLGFLGNIAAIQWLMVNRAESLQHRFHAVQRAREVAEAMAVREHAQAEEQRSFIAMLTHELKTPLSVVRMALGAKPPTDRVRSRALQAISDVDQVIDRVAQAGKLEDGEDGLCSRPCQLWPTVEDCLVSIRDSGREIHCLMMPEGHAPPEFRCDPFALRTILLNLLDNAAKYGLPGAPVSLVWREQMQGHRQGLLLRIANQVGKAGRPDPELAFQKYYRAAAAHSQVGSGLGLYIIKGLAHKLGGRLTLSAEEPEVVFELWLPL